VIGAVYVIGAVQAIGAVQVVGAAQDHFLETERAPVDPTVSAVKVCRAVVAGTAMHSEAAVLGRTTDRPRAPVAVAARRVWDPEEEALALAGGGEDE
jgi:hypothetical protein